jgi:uncharacterized membrane protein
VEAKIMDKALKFKLICVGLIIFYIIGTYLTMWKFGESLYGNFQNYKSLMLTGIVIGSVALIFFLIARIIDKPKITQENAETYLTASITIIVAVFAIIGLIFSIIYGSLYTTSTFLPITEHENLIKLNYSDKDINNYSKALIRSGITLVLITTYAVVSIIISFIWPLTEKLGEKQSEKIEKSPTVSFDEAQYILRIRYAKSEITKKQFEQKKKDLEK